MSSTRTPLTRLPGGRRFAPAAVLATALFLSVLPVGTTHAQTQATVRVVTDAGGSRLQVDGRDFLVQGMNWDYFPVGQNYAYNFWGQPDDVHPHGARPRDGAAQGDGRQHHPPVQRRPAEVGASTSTTTTASTRCSTTPWAATA